MSDRSPQAVVVGVGGAGVNAVSRLMDVGIRGVTFVAADASTQTLDRASGASKVPLGTGRGGLGTGGDRGLGAAAAEDSESELAAALDNPDIVFVVAGLAGGTGGGAAPVVARIARRRGALTIGFGIEPFAFEAAGRIRAARQSGRELADACDMYVALDNDKTHDLTGKSLSLDVALRVADDTVRQAVQGLTELVSDCGWINVDLATVRRVLNGTGEGCLAMGVGRGDGATSAAMAAAMSSPLVDMTGVEHARAVLVQVTGGPDLTVAAAASAADTLRPGLSPGCDFVVGVACDPVLADAVQVTVLAAGVDLAAARAGRAAVQAARVASPAAARVARRQRATERPVRAAGVLACLNVDFDLLEPVAQAV